MEKILLKPFVTIFCLYSPLHLHPTSLPQPTPLLLHLLRLPPKPLHRPPPRHPPSILLLLPPRSLRLSRTRPLQAFVSLKEEELNSSCGHACIAWLDRQPRGSVVFLCFRSMGRFSAAQVREIAAGLERSGRQFLWVLRAPPKEGQGDYVASTNAIIDEVLPEGFVERTQERGFVWPSFAPQERAVRVLMGEGSAKMREKVKKMKEAARRVVGAGGCSRLSLEKVMARWVGDD